ncbi:MAG: DNA repair protein RecN [Fimbriimonadaceae bacterium]|nr:DNA repair protein RecN [Fimbriimonadaceae bacterium]
MIREIAVEQIAVIESARLELGPGLTVLTGETGAGKSLLVDAIELALGGRADTDQIRTGAMRGRVTMNVEGAIASRLFGSSPAMIEREIHREGRSSCRLNGKPALVGELRQLGNALVDLHGQHQHQTLLDPLSHGSFLDAWIGEPAAKAKHDVADAFAKWHGIQTRLASLRRDQRDRDSRIDLLRFQVDEIEAAAPLIGEFEELEATSSRFAHAEKLMAIVQQVLAGLYEDELAARDRVGDAAKLLEAGAALDPELSIVAEPIRDARYSLEEGLARLGEYRDRLEYEPAEADRIAERLDLLKNLRRKYGPDEAAVIAYLDQARTELSALTDTQYTEEELLRQAEQAEADFREKAGGLTALRTGAAKPFAKVVVAELRELAMEKAEFDVSLSPRPADGDGVDAIEFLFSANPGETVRPLAKIASGGEMSRVMLALKVCLAGKAGVPCLIFDEVDAGLSGNAAATVARKLGELAQHVQVVAISHLPQVAANADTHYRIEKVVESGRTQTRLRLLDPDERVVELARMLSGDSVTEAAKANARELLAMRLSLA